MSCNCEIEAQTREHCMNLTRVQLVAYIVSKSQCLKRVPSTAPLHATLTVEIKAAKEVYKTRKLLGDF